MVCVIATATAREGMETTLRDALTKLADSTRREAGCLQYDVHVGTESPTQLAVYERWSDDAAIDAHFEEPHTKAFFELAATLVAEPPRILRYRLVS